MSSYEVNLRKPAPVKTPAKKVKLTKKK